MTMTGMMDLIPMARLTAITGSVLFSILYSKFHPYPPIQTVQFLCLDIENAAFYARSLIVS